MALFVASRSKCSGSNFRASPSAHGLVLVVGQFSALLNIRTSRVNGARRIEIVGAEEARIPELKAMGCFTEIIAHKTRVFVPIDRIEKIFENLAS